MSEPSLSEKEIQQYKEGLAASIMVNLYYIKFDYPLAVKEGKVINEFEFKEQIDLGQSITKDISKLEIKANQKILNLMASLIKNLKLKNKSTAINKLTESIIKLLRKEYPIHPAPPVWPSLVRGKDLYIKNCISCHGANGRGNGISLSPPPANFHKRTANGPSPFNYYLSIKHGIENTAMASYGKKLTDKQIWDVSHYIYSFKLKKDKSFDEDLFIQSYKKITLYELAQRNDEFVLNILKNKKALNMLRHHSMDSPLDSHLLIVKVCLELAQEAYAKKNIELTKVFIRKAYYEGLESIEQSKDTKKKYEDAKTSLKQAIHIIEDKKSLKELKLNNQLILKKLQF